jgi:chromosome partitioning protein
VDIIKARQDVTNGKPKAAFVISRSIRNTKLGREVEEALESYGLPILKSMTTQRVAYPTTAAEGQTVFVEREGAAAHEIDAIKNEAKELLHGA